MRKRRVALVDLVTKGPCSSLYGRVMHANLASIMPQVLGTWCEAEGHDVSFLCYTGFEDIGRDLPADADIVFIGAFTQAAQLAYAISAFCRSRGAVTVLGGPHARCYPEDAARYFDYVLGFTDREVVRTVLSDCQPHRPEGLQLAAATQPAELPGVRERWKFIEPTLAKAPVFQLVPMIASLGCPYTCSFCIDSVVPYQPLDWDVIREDLRFLRTKFRRPAVPVGSIDFAAESSLSVLSEPHLQRLQRNGFKAILPGIESWYDLGNKARTGRKQGVEKVEQVAEHVNLIQKYIPYLQANFVLGLDSDEGSAPFDLTKQFVDRSPGAFPGYSLLSAFGRAAPLNLEYQRSGRVLPFPFHFLNNNHAMNVVPANYEWSAFYDQVISLTRYSFSPGAIWRRFRAIKERIPRWLNVVRAMSSEGYGRIKYFTELRQRLDTDRPLRRFYDGETTDVPAFFLDRMKRDLGPLWAWLPPTAVNHDPTAYLKTETTTQITPIRLGILPGPAAAAG